MKISQRLWNTYPELCKSFDSPKIWGTSKTLDWTEMPTTADQREIEDAIEAEDIGGRAILHAGIGNSSLAKRLLPRAARLTGLTVSEKEEALAASFSLPAYTVHLLNKYSPRLYTVVGGGYDLIVDNALASYACCRVHYRTLFLSYALALNAGGRILTHRRGMSWSADRDRGQRLITYDDLAALETSFPFHASKVTNDVYALTRCAG
jgi:hypothetical protein